MAIVNEGLFSSGPGVHLNDRWPSEIGNCFAGNGGFKRRPRQNIHSGSEHGGSFHALQVAQNLASRDSE